jgi:hypothetical protein
MHALKSIISRAYRVLQIQHLILLKKIKKTKTVIIMYPRASYGLGFSMTLNVGIFIGCTKDIGPRWHMRIEYRQGNLFMSQLAACIETIFIYLFIYLYCDSAYSIWVLKMLLKVLPFFLLWCTFTAKRAHQGKRAKQGNGLPPLGVFFGIAELGEIAQILIFSFKAFLFFFILICFVKIKF